LDPIPILHDGTGYISVPEEMATILYSTFFNCHIQTSPTYIYDTDPLPQHTFYPITDNEVTSALHSLSSTSAPGPSGVTYKMIWRLHDLDSTYLPDFFIRCIKAGVVPWTNTKVAVMPKPGKSDYTSACSYHPISLLECPEKVLETVICTHLQVDTE
jgi:hypothetical protein